MSGGIHALRGFDYQATVILDRLFEHFDERGTDAKARPEGMDDLDLFWCTADGLSHRRFEQIKKPREDRDVNPVGGAWTIAQIASELIPSALAKLHGNAHEQVWILGDEVEAEVADLIAAGQAAPSYVPATYWRVVHLLARDEALKAPRVDVAMRRRLARWTVTADLLPDPDAALPCLLEGFKQHASTLRAAAAIADQYAAAARRFHACLPDVLSRIRIFSLFGSEEEVALRVRERLERRYSLQPSVVEDTLFRNIRGFINDIAKQPGRCFGQEEFEFELRSVWPTMLPIREPPPLDRDHIPRSDLSARFTTSWSGRALEVVGVSGAGKTMLAAEVHQRLRTVDPGRMVLYAEVRPDTELRDVLLGTAFHLRRHGLGQPFAVGVVGTAASQVVVDRLARALSAIPKDILLLIDLVQGTCSEALTNDLAAFIRSLSSGACRVAVLGQESAFRHLGASERERHGVERMDVRGFNIDEFVSLVSRRHPNPDRALVHDVFRKVTAGRSAGLYAKLARSLADAPSLEAMRELAERPADEILERAERQRFARVSDGARPAAEKLVCFALPFGRPEAEKVFADVNVGAAVRDLLDLGLLRNTEGDRYEMHEIVRAGLEGMIALRTRQEAHSALAAHYKVLDDVAAEILHLERAGRPGEARERARTTFLRGEHWTGLAGYVTAHELVTPGEVIRVMAAPGSVEGSYLLADVLSQLSQPFDVHDILTILRGQPQRFASDHEWGSALAVACLAFDAGCLDELIQFGLKFDGTPDRREAGLTTILIAARRRGCAVGPETLTLFGASAPEDKRLLLPFLLAHGRRDALAPALAFMACDEEEALGCHESSRVGHYLKAESLDEAVEFLAALPDLPDDVILAYRSPLPAPLASLIWSNRQPLRGHCVAILQTVGMEPAVQKAAIRVLALLAEPRLPELCEALAAQDGNPIRSFAALALSLVPALVDRDRYEARLLDPEQDIERRVVSLTILAAIRADLGALYDRLQAAEHEPERSDLWDFFFLQNAARAPFPAAISLLKAHLRSPEADGHGVYIGALASLGRLPSPTATAMLLEAISHHNASVRGTAAMILQGKRSRSALPSLKQRFRIEENPSITVLLATAIVASGPSSVADLAMARSKSPALSLWRCVLAARTRDSTFAPELVALATDASANWQLRRAAINAAGFLPFDAALVHILPVLRERSPLTIDDHQSLSTHATLSCLLLTEAPSLLPRFIDSRSRFVGLVGGILDEARQRLIDPRGLPPAMEAAEWLYDRLEGHGWPRNTGAPDAVLNELHVPLLHSAILRALRQAGRSELIQAELARADHTWLATKCLLECVRAGQSDPDAVDGLASLLARSPVAGDTRLERIIEEIVRGSRRTSSSLAPNQKEEPVRRGTLLSYDEAVLALTGGVNANLAAQAPIVLGALIPEQFDQLARLADPLNDHHVAAELYIPEVKLHRRGHSVTQRRQTYSSASEPAGAWIRPAVVAANRLNFPVRWHREILSGPMANTYADRLLACLAASGDAEAFYRILYRDPDLLLPHICSEAARSRIATLIDGRMVPFLTMHLSSGTEEVFAGLCGLARTIDSPAIDAVLPMLFRRWTGHLEGWRAVGPQPTSHRLWHAFRDLTEHPRFNLIEDWHECLLPVLQAPLAWHEKQRVTQVLERDPRSYIQMESLLFKSEDWAHFYEEEIDRLQEVAERLFVRVAD